MKPITLKRSETESIVIQERIHPETKELFIDIRKWYKDESGENKPTMRGLCLTQEEFKQLSENFNR